MLTKFIEVTNNEANWGKFLLLRFDHEWEIESAIEPGSRLLPRLGWSKDHLWVLDLQTGEGIFIRPGGLASADLEKHAVWVCPMYEPFLEWLYQQDLTDLTKLPAKLNLKDAPFALRGYRRPGPKKGK